MATRMFKPAAIERNAEQVADILKALANPRRLLILCRLAEVGGESVGELARHLNLSQSALSQHLAVMRQERLVTFTRDRQTLTYRIADPKLETLLDTLYALYCSSAESDQKDDQ